MNNTYIIINKTDKNSSYKLKENVFLKIVNDRCIIENNIIHKNNYNYYFLKKKYNIESLKKLKNNNYLIYEPLDMDWNSYPNFELYYKNNLDYFNIFNEIICNNKFMAQKMTEYGFNNKLSINYHEYDEKYKSTGNIVNKILYIGRLDKCSFTNKDMIKYNINNINNFNEINKDITIHIDYLLNNNLYYTLHTSTKLSTALYLNCIFICNRIPVYVELLGEDYEFYLNDDLSNIDKIIEKAQKILNTKDLYDEYINKCINIKNRVSPNTIAKNYNFIFNNKINNKIENKIENKINNKIENKIENKINNKINNTFIIKKLLFQKKK